MSWKWNRWKNGYRTTIDLNYPGYSREVVARHVEKRIDAASGTAVVMEVATGEVKAITNMGRIREGVYGEDTNHAVADETEPGSTFKVASIMVALEDGVCSPAIRSMLATVSICIKGPV